MRKNKGNILVVVLTLLLVASVGISGYLFFQNQQLSKQHEEVLRLTPTIRPLPINRDETADWKIYANPKLGFEFKYPLTIKLSVNQGFTDADTFYKSPQVLVGVAKIDSNLFYYYGPGGGGVRYANQYFINLNRKTLIFLFNGPYDDDKTPTAAAKKLHEKILSTFKFL